MATDIVDRAAQTFPELTPAQIERIASAGVRREVRAGEMLFDVGDQNTRFFVVLSGGVDILRPAGDSEEPVITHDPGQFTGEINMLSARRSLVRARVRADGVVLAVDRDELRTLVQRDPELSEILMRAFILRRLRLMGELAPDTVLLGSRHSGATQTIRDFLSRNGQPSSTKTSRPTRTCRSCLIAFTSFSPAPMSELETSSLPERPTRCWSWISAATPSILLRLIRTSSGMLANPALHLTGLRPAGERLYR